MPKITMQVIPEPHDRSKTIMAHDGAGTVVIYGPTKGHRYLCGVCAATLIVGMQLAQIKSIVVKCASCGAFNGMG